MNKKNTTIAGSILTILVILVIAFIRSPLMDQWLGGADGDAGGEELVVLATADPEEGKKPAVTEAPKATEKPKATATPKPTATPEPTAETAKSDLKFRSKKLLNEHYEKHGVEMGFSSAKDYEAAAAAVVANPDALHKTEKEDGDDVYYLEETNEFVIVSKDGYIRTYFLPSGGKKYYDKQ